MLKINNRLKKLKHKVFRRLRADIWGTVGLKNKNNLLTKKLKEYLDQDFKSKIRYYKKALKTKAYKVLEKKKLFSRRYIRRKKRFYIRPEFDFDVIAKAKEKRRKRISYRGMLLNQKRRFLIFFGEHFLRKQLRKMVKVNQIKRNRFLEKKSDISFPSQKNIGSVFGSRLDLTLFRSQFCATMRQCRELVKHGKVKVMTTSDTFSFFKFSTIKNLAYQVPLFTPIKLSENLIIKRKNEFRHKLLTNCLYYARVKDLYLDYRTFVSIRIVDTNNQKFPFGSNLSYLAGLAKFF